MKKNVVLLFLSCILHLGIVAQVDSIIHSPPAARSFHPSPLQNINGKKKDLYECCKHKIKINDKSIDLISISTDSVIVSNLYYPTILFQDSKTLIIIDKSILFSLTKNARGKLIFTKFDNSPLLVHFLKESMFNIEIKDDQYLITVVSREKNDFYGFRREVNKYYYTQEGKLVNTQNIGEVRCTDNHLWSKEEYDQPQFYNYKDNFISWQGGSNNSIRVTSSKTSKIVYETPPSQSYAGIHEFSSEFKIDKSEAILATNEIDSRKIHLSILDLNTYELNNEIIELEENFVDGLILLKLEKRKHDIFLLFKHTTELYVAKYNLDSKRISLLNISERININRSPLKEFIVFGDEKIYIHIAYYGDGQNMPLYTFYSIPLKNLTFLEDFSFLNLTPYEKPNFEVMNFDDDYFLLQAKRGSFGNYKLEFFLCKIM